MGEWDNAIRTEVGQADYIVDREYYYTSDVSWGDYNASQRIYSASHFPDPGGRWDDTAAINSKFDQAYNNGQIYHGMFHPLILSEAQWQNVTDHLDYIGGRKDVWYVGFGHLYMYHYLQEFSDELLSIETVGFFTDTSDLDFQEGMLNNAVISNGSIRLQIGEGLFETFGKTSIGGSSARSSKGFVRGNKVPLSEGGNVTSIGVYLTGAVGNVRMAIYDDNNGSPRNLIAETPFKIMVEGWNIHNISADLNPGTYWL